MLETAESVQDMRQGELRRSPTEPTPAHLLLNSPT